MKIKFSFIFRTFSFSLPLSNVLSRQESQLETLFKIAKKRSSRQRKYETHPPNP